MRRKEDAPGEPLSYKELPKEKSIKSIRGIFKLWNKSKKFILRLNINVAQRLYVHKDGKILTSDRQEAKRFAHGFDNPDLKRDFWAKKMNANLIVENL